MKAPKIIFKDEDILVVDKPAGMPSVSLKKNEEGTLASWLLKKFPGLAVLPKGGLEAGLVHRLDNSTSGIMLAARNQEAYENLRRQFTEGKVLKEYLALVIGNPPSSGTIKDPIAHHDRKKKKMIVSKTKGRPAETSFKLIKRFAKDYALLAVTIKTGARHQIRLHLSSIGFPIAGDSLYQNPKKKLKDISFLPRHFLHASKLGFTHPKNKKWMEASSDLSCDLKAVLTKLDSRND